MPTPTPYVNEDVFIRGIAIPEKATPRPTLAQVAARAGVSLKTASRALGGESYVSAKTLAYALRMDAVTWQVRSLVVENPMPNRDVDPELSADGCQLLVASNRATPPLRDIYAFQVIGRR